MPATEKSLDATPSPDCGNCGAPFAAGAAYCPNCGQATAPPAWNLRDWASEALSTFFHFEGKTWRTLRDLYVPGRIETAYVAGRRQSYLHPLRILLLAILLLFAAVNLFEGTAPALVNVTEDISDGMQGEAPLDALHAERIRLQQQQDSLTRLAAELQAQLAQLTNGPVDLSDANAFNERITDLTAEISALEQQKDDLKIGAKVLGETDTNSFDEHPAMLQGRSIDLLRAKVAVYDVIHARIDTLVARQQIRDTNTLALLDSVAAAVGSPDDFWPADTTRLLFGESYILRSRDIAESGPDQLPMPGIHSAINRLVITRGFQLYRAGNDSFRDYLWNHLSWAILAFVPMLSLVYKGFYFRKRPFYAQHLVHVSILVGCGLTLLLIGTSTQRWVGAGVWVVLAAIHFVYTVAADRKFYQTSYVKALLKGVTISLLGMIVFMFAFVSYLGVAVLLG